MTRTTRRETNRLRAEIMDGLAEYLDERAGERRLRLESDRSRAKVARCGTLIDEKAMPAAWLSAIMRTCAPHVVFMPEFRFGVSRPQPLLH